MTKRPQLAVTVADLAEQAGVSDQHIRNLIAAGRLEAMNVGKGARPVYRIPVEAAERFLARPAFAPTSAAA